MNTISNDACLQELGSRLRALRLNHNLTQADLANRAGVAPRTLRALESGMSASMDTWLSLLRALGALEQINQFLPPPPTSPLALAKLKGRTRRRASGVRASERPERKQAGQSANWTWAD